MSCYKKTFLHFTWVEKVLLFHIYFDVQPQIFSSVWSVMKCYNPTRLDETILGYFLGYTLYCNSNTISCKPNKFWAILPNS